MHLRSLLLRIAIWSSVVIAMSSGHSFGATTKKELQIEVDRIIRASGPYEALGIGSTQLGFAEDSYIEKMTAISLETNAAIVAENPVLKEQITAAQAKLFDSFLSLERYKAKYNEWASDGPENGPVQSKSLRAMNLVEQLKRDRDLTATDLGLIAVRDDIPLLDLIKVSSDGPYSNQTAQLFFSKSKNDRVALLSSMKPEEFEALLFEVLIYSKSSDGIYLPAAIDKMMKTYSKLQEPKKTAKGLRVYFSENSVRKVMNLLLRVESPALMLNGFMNLVDYGVVANKLGIVLGAQTSLLTGMLQIDHENNADESPEVAQRLETIMEVQQSIENSKPELRHFLHLYSFQAKYRALRLLTLCRLGLNGLGSSQFVH